MNRIGGSRSIPSKESVATKRDIAELRHEIQLAVRDLTLRVGVMFIAFYGLALATLAALKFF
jgi:tetrahydromethanopterin S-methyltransferase subunit F